MVSRFLHRYYICNVLLFTAYVALRVQRLDPGELGEKDFMGCTREFHIYLSLGLLLFARLFSSPTPDAYIATAFKGMGIVVMLCLWFMDLRLCQYFGAVYLAVLILCPQPRFQYPRSIVSLNHQSFQTRITNNTHKSFYIVWAHATWHPRCTQLGPVFADLAHRFKHPRITFAKVDLGRWTEAAKLIDVAVEATTRQLPCVVVYRRGKEVARLPRTVGDHGDIEKRWMGGFTANNLCEELKMEDVKIEAEKWEEEARSKLCAMKAKESKKAQ